MSEQTPSEDSEIGRLKAEEERTRKILLEQGVDLRDARARIIELKGLIREMLPWIQGRADADLIDRASKAAAEEPPPP